LIRLRRTLFFHQSKISITMLESQIILTLQKMLNSPMGRAVIVLCARFLIFVYLLIPFSIRSIPALRSGSIIASWSALLAFAFTSGIATFVDRIRPYLAVRGVVAIVPPNIQDGSFPSSHTAIAFAISASIFSVHQGWGIVAFIIAFLIAFGRISAGMHYPTDVLGGMAVGLLAFMCVTLVQSQLKKIV
jgi:membrane-associated phospholipid phosphatase